MKVKKLLAAGLAAAMMLGTLAGCGGGKENSGGNTGGEDSKSQEASAETKESEKESGGETASGEIVNLKWVTIGNGMPTNYDTWITKVNDYIGEKIGVNLEMEVIPWGDWDNRRNIIISTNEPYDIIFGNGNNYLADINLGAYYDITDMLDANMPGLNELMPAKYWDAVKVKDRIYGVPTYKDSSISNYSIWDKELVDEYSLDVASMTELASMTETFETLKADKNDYPVYVKNDGLYYIFDVYDQIGGGTQILGVRYDDADGKAHKINEEWAMAGYTQGSFFTVTQIDTDEFDQWGEIKALNEAAVSSAMLGFNLDTSAITDQLANCCEIWLRYRSEVMTGVQDPAVAVPQIKEELMNAGWQDVMDEAQRQVDEFLGK